MPAIRNIAVGLPLKDGHLLALEGHDRSRGLDFDAVPLDAELRILDEGSPVRWVPIDDIRSGTRVLFPSGAPESLFAIAGR